MQRRMFEAGGCEPVIEIDTDHAPWISRTDELVAALDRLAARDRAIDTTHAAPALIGKNGCSRWLARAQGRR